MAEQIPYGVASSLINTLASLAFEEVASIYGVEDEIDWLKKVEAIKAVLADADKKQQTDQLIQIWIRELKQVLYEADDLLDDLHTQHLLRNRDPKGKGKGKVREFFSSSNPIVYRHKIAREIRNIRKKFDAVAETMSKLNLDRRVVVEMKHEKSNRRETSSKHEENIIGRKGNKKDIIDLLLNHNNNSNQNVFLVAVVGIGGLGKTALAQLVFNDPDVKSFFAKRMWVCVSQDFDVKALVKLILESLLDKKQKDKSLELLQNKLLQKLGGQKFLLVLDDIWNEDREKWFKLNELLMCGAEGSKILLTTRNQAVANVMGVERPYVLKGLTHEQSWTLFKRLAFDKDKVMNLETIGRKIVQKCAGVPLAIRVMGSLLRTKSRESDWEAILNGDFWTLHEGKDDSIMPILKLSYDSLAIELKQCFAYCSLYPKDWLYEKEELIHLWMANGFLENEDETLCLEDIGEKYVRILLMKSFLQDVETNALGEITHFKMHDLMHDLSQSIASSDYCLYVKGKNSVERCPIHASFESCDSNSSQNLLDPSRLRTFLETSKNCQRNPSNLFVFKRLRGLDLSFYRMTNLPESIGNMRHLRYLNLSHCTKLTCLPKSIRFLVNLQTLRLNMCLSLEFPVDIITKLIYLRHLHISRCKALEDGMPIGLGKMTTLQHLSDFIAGKDDTKAKLNELKELNLRGELVIDNLHLVRDVKEESKDVGMATKEHLISLTLSWGKEFSSEMKNSDPMQLLENLRPHKNLKALTIKNYPGRSLSNWILSCKALVQLKFIDVNNCEYLGALEGLVSLKTLHIVSMDKLEYIFYEGCSSLTNFFPSLEELIIFWCRRLKGWQREGNVQNTRDNEGHHSLPPFSRLSSLQISYCPNLSCMPTFPNVVKHLIFIDSNTEPLLDTLGMRTSGLPSTSNDMATSLSNLKSLEIGGTNIEALPEQWMQNLFSLKHLSITNSPTPEKLFHHMRNLPATLEAFHIFYLRSWDGYEDNYIHYGDLRCLHSLQEVKVISCNDLTYLPEWICDLQSLKFIHIKCCKELRSFPEGMCRLNNLQTLQLDAVNPLLKERCHRETGAEWWKIAHIPDIQIDGHPI